MDAVDAKIRSRVRSSRARSRQRHEVRIAHRSAAGGRKKEYGWWAKPVAWNSAGWALTNALGLPLARAVARRRRARRAAAGSSSRRSTAPAGTAAAGSGSSRRSWLRSPSGASSPIRIVSVDGAVPGARQRGVGRVDVRPIQPGRDQHPLAPPTDPPLRGQPPRLVGLVPDRPVARPRQRLAVGSRGAVGAAVARPDGGHELAEVGRDGAVVVGVLAPAPVGAIAHSGPGAVTLKSTPIPRRARPAASSRSYGAQAAAR